MSNRIQRINHDWIHICQHYTIPDFENELRKTLYKDEQPLFLKLKIISIQLSLVGEFLVICMGHRARVPKGSKGRSQEAQRASSMKSGPEGPEASSQLYFHIPLLYTSLYHGS